jgi:hypothetical protein
MKISRLLLGVASLCAFSAVNAADLEIKVQNLTHGTYYTPLIIAAHNSATKMFSVGMPSSMSLTKMAEGGDIAGLDADLMAAGANVVKNTAAGLLAPGKTATTMLTTTGSNMYLSLAAMLLPTNDGFVAANAIKIPTEKGEHVFMLNAYDSGTEANDEKRGGGAVGGAGFPVPPASGVDTMSGTGGTGITGLTAEGFVHIHRGVLGDDNATGGKSDINNMTQRWLNPVARLVITVK